MDRSEDNNKSSVSNVFVKLEVGVVAPKELEVPRRCGGMMSLGKRARGVEWMERAGVVESVRSKIKWSVTGCKKTIDGSNGGGHDTSEAVAPLAGMGGRMLRQFWVKERDNMWWEEVSSLRCRADEFKRMFCMSWATFEMLCRELEGAVAKGDTPMRKAVPVHKRVAVCIWRLSSGESLRQVSLRFGLGISTCHKISLEVCIAIKDLLMPKFIVWPKGPSAEVVATQFEAAYGIPNVIGAIYNVHIPIIAPRRNAAYYDNHHLTEHMKKPSYSITMQSVVDVSGSFSDICVGYPGSMSDEDVLLQSSLNKERGETGLIQGQRKWLLGGSSYPVTDWVLAPYIDSDLTQVQRLFNKKVTDVRMVAKDAIMRFKARWKILQKRRDMNLEDFPIMVSVCCVLHNICERNGDTLDPQLAFNHVDNEMLAKEPVRSDAASRVRDTIAQNLIIPENSIRTSSFLSPSLFFSQDKDRKTEISEAS